MSELKKVEVIVSTDKEGKTTPYRIRLVAEDGELVVIPIISILFAEEIRKESTIKYRIKCQVQERERIMDLFFSKVNMQWHLKI
jgi:hypothetical protein